MVKAEPAIRQLLKLDFEPKVSTTIRSHFRQTIDNTIKTHLLPMARQQADKILQYYPQARQVLEQTLEREAIAKIALNQKAKLELEEQVTLYNQSVTGLNNCLRSPRIYFGRSPSRTKTKQSLIIGKKFHAKSQSRLPSNGGKETQRFLNL
jgi:hypothetical protein